MTPEDPRHGTAAGYQAHRRDGEPACGPCASAKFRYGKRIRIENARGERLYYSSQELADIMAPWLRMGISANAIAVAGGLDGQRSAHLSRTIANGTRVRRSTYLALAGVTEDDFAPTAKVFADLTRRRIFSLMAIGQRLNDMPINREGQWRYRDHVTIGTARDIRAYYRENEARIGDVRNTQSRARNAGHYPPMAWDDPGTLAWPSGVPELPADWQYRPASRADIIADLDEHGATLSDVCRALKLSADTLERWCTRHDLWDLFKRLKSRETGVWEASA